MTEIGSHAWVDARQGVTVGAFKLSAIQRLRMLWEIEQIMCAGYANLIAPKCATALNYRLSEELGLGYCDRRYFLVIHDAVSLGLGANTGRK